MKTVEESACCAALIMIVVCAVIGSVAGTTDVSSWSDDLAEAILLVWAAGTAVLTAILTD